MTWFVTRTVLGHVGALLVALLIVFAFTAIGDGARLSLGDWLGRLLVGDFGFSVSQNAPAAQLLAGGLAVTLPLVAFAAILAALIGVPAGLAAARRPASTAGRAVGVAVRLGRIVPEFWLGMLLVLVFATTLRWLPPGGFLPWQGSPLGALRSLLLPTLALGLPHAALLAGSVRDALADARRSPAVRGARARGLPLEEAVRRHGVRAAVLGLLGPVGHRLAEIVAGALVVETVFYLPGLGRLSFDAVVAHDSVLVRAVLVVVILAIVLMALATALSAAWLDPRLRDRVLP
jgi:peptide/nickel transport system permease protein